MAPGHWAKKRVPTTKKASDRPRQQKQKKRAHVRSFMEGIVPPSSQRTKKTQDVEINSSFVWWWVHPKTDHRFFFFFFRNMRTIGARARIPNIPHTRRILARPPRRRRRVQRNRPITPILVLHAPPPLPAHTRAGRLKKKRQLQPHTDTFALSPYKRKTARHETNKKQRDANKKKRSSHFDYATRETIS